MPKNEDHSFNDAMNEWAAKQSFFQNPRNRIIHPDPSLPWVFRALGYLFRLLVVVLIATILLLYGMKKYVGGQAFGTMMAEKVGALLDAEEYEGRRYVWKGTRGTTKLFSAKGSEQAFYKDLKAISISFSMPRSAFFGDAWKLKSLDIAELDMTLRVGRSTNAARVPELLPTLAAGFGINPNLERLSFDLMEIAHTNLRWGVSKTTQGSILDAPMDIIRDAGNWTLRFKGGTLFQNWWNGFAIRSLDVQLRDGKLLFTNAKFGLPKGGSANLTGDMTLGAIPQANLQMNISDAEVAGLIPAAFHRFLGGEVNASIAITGSPNTRSGLATDATLEVVGARLRNLPAFEALSLLLETSRVRHLPLTSGTVQFETSDGEWRVTDIDIQCEGVGVLRGNFTVSERKVEQETLAPLDSPEKSAEEVPELPIAERWNFDGKLRLGVPSAKLSEFDPAAKDFFKDDGSGTSWIDIMLDGPINEVTRALRDEIIEAIRS